MTRELRFRLPMESPKKSERTKRREEKETKGRRERRKRNGIIRYSSQRGLSLVKKEVSW